MCAEAFTIHLNFCLVPGLAGGIRNALPHRLSGAFDEQGNSVPRVNSKTALGAKPVKATRSSDSSPRRTENLS